MRALLLCRTTMGLATVMRTYNVDFRVLLRLGGAGFRVLGRLGSRRLTGRWRRLLLFLSKPDDCTAAEFEWWIAGGKPLNPYLRGQLAERIRRTTRPKELRLPNGGVPSEGGFSDIDYELLERTVMPEWVLQWLEWVKWSAVVAEDLNTPLRDLFDCPVVETSWKRRNVDSDILRFGLLWRIFDRATRGLSRSPLILGSFECGSGKYAPSCATWGTSG